MSDIFLKVFNMSITASWLILAVLCFRLVFRRAPKWLNCLLWGVVAFRLVCPFSLESDFSLQPSAQPVRMATAADGEAQPYIPVVDSHLEIVENNINPMLRETFSYQQSDSVAPLQVVTFAAGNVWLAGMLFMAGFAAVSMIRLRGRLQEAVRCRKNIYICDNVSSPFILGVISPRIYLPSALPKGEAEYIVAHEKAHLRRKDHWWKPLGYLLLCVHWFNPLCWAAYILLCRDIELACDEKVVKDMPIQEKKAYLRVLLSCAQRKRMVLMCPLAFGEVGIKERVRSVLRYKKPAFLLLLASAAVCMIIAVCFLTNPRREYRIGVTIPAGNTGEICYADEEICPKGSSLTFYAGEGLGDGTLQLIPVEAAEENAYDEAWYITPGMPVKIEVEKGAWFRLGIVTENPTGADKEVYVSVKNVDTRVSSHTEEPESGFPVLGEISESGQIQEKTARELAYGKALWEAYLTGTLPDGSSLDYQGEEEAAKNSFAVADVDRDGEQELLLIWDNGIMAGRAEYVFGYDEARDRLYEKLVEWPLIRFYDNGFAVADWSHNQGPSAPWDVFWPYNVYRYDTEKDGYLPYATVTSWDSSIRDTPPDPPFYSEGHFPQDLDQDGDGILYYIFPGQWDGYYSDDCLVDGGGLAEWENACLGGASREDIAVQSLTEENIIPFGYPKPSVEKPQPQG